MLGAKHSNTEIPYESWLINARRTAIRAIEQTGTSISAAIFKRHWTFAGHLARADDPFTKSIVQFRSTAWIEANRALHHSNPNR
eukprot:1712362-Karenia_brevis.AAC.1